MIVSTHETVSIECRGDEVEDTTAKMVNAGYAYIRSGQKEGVDNHYLIMNRTTVENIES